MQSTIIYFPHGTAASQSYIPTSSTYNLTYIHPVQKNWLLVSVSANSKGRGLYEDKLALPCGKRPRDGL
jgi:hypothetical protein